MYYKPVWNLNKFLYAMLFFFLFLQNRFVHSYDLSFLFQTDIRYSVEKGILSLGGTFVETKIDQALGSSAAVSGGIRLSYYSMREYLQNEGDKVEAELRNTYLDLFDFPVKNLELRIGKQRINIGKSDFFRHLDVVNPPDFSDELRFDERVSSLLLRLKWTLGFDTSWMFFIGPGIDTARYAYGTDPYRAMRLEVESYMPAYTGAPGSAADIFRLPELRAENMLYGLIFSSKIGKFDFSFLAVSRFNPILMPEEILIDSTDSSASIIYSTRREYVIGLGAAGDVLGAGVWVEIAAKKSRGFSTVVKVDGSIVENSSLLTDEWFFTWSAGIDYNFKNNGPYLNIEFSHGFFTEMQNSTGEGINDYLVITIQKKYSSDRINLGLSLGFEFDKLTNSADFDDFKRHTAWFTGPFFKYSLGNNVELETGLFWVTAPKETSFGASDMRALFYFKTAAKF